jgi:predicted lipoprotein with Yx(FWY)xxD motif
MLRPGGDTPAVRQPVGPPPSLPPGFEITTTNRGRMLLNDKRYSVYSSDKDGVDKSNCFGLCAEVWQPIAAPASAQPMGDWSIVERAPGVRQWAYRHKPLYTYTHDVRPDSEDGGDVPGWRNVYTQTAPNPPKGFTVQNTLGGDVLADSHGKSIYIYTCDDDSFDQLACDTLDSPQQYRLAICGGFDVKRCHDEWHYVLAEPNAKSDSKVWSIVDIDPATDRRAEPGQAGAIKVWAYRDRPVWTYAGDKEAGDYNGNGNGEWQGRRNGFRVFWIRDEFGGRFG